MSVRGRRGHRQRDNLTRVRPPKKEEIKRRCRRWRRRRRRRTNPVASTGKTCTLPSLRCASPSKDDV